MSGRRRTKYPRWGLEDDLLAVPPPRDVLALAKEAGAAGLPQWEGFLRDRGRDLAWAMTSANEPLALNFVAREAPWTTKDQEVFDDALQEARLLLFRAAETWNPAVNTFAGWAWRVLAAQLKIRVREGQGRYGPDGCAASLDAPARDEDGDPTTLGETLPAPPEKDADRVEDERAAYAARIRDVLRAIRATPRMSRLADDAARRAAVRWCLFRALGVGDRAGRALRLARRRGVRLGDLRAIDAEWRGAYRHGVCKD